jgi:hypothetical protein
MKIKVWLIMREDENSSEIPSQGLNSIFYIYRNLILFYSTVTSIDDFMEQMISKFISLAESISIELTRKYHHHPVISSPGYQLHLDC